MTTARTSSPAPVDHDGRWRPGTDGPPCDARPSRSVVRRLGREDAACGKRGAHYCEPRADRAALFFAVHLRHTKGRWARASFDLAEWQEHEIVRPLFGEVEWSEEWGCYARRYHVAYIVLGRKNGKSEIVAGLVLLLLVGDDEEGAEVYGAARDTKQAGKVGDVVVRMRQLSPKLAGITGYNKNSRRVFHEGSSSYFEVITADALGQLGHNPHGWYIDEVLSQRDDSLYTALRTAEGARHQPLGMLVTTETNDPFGFGAAEIDEAERVQEDPSRAPHVFSYVRKLPRRDDEVERLRRIFPGHPDLPVSTDPWDERNWKWPNPALDEFLSREALRREALDARNEPAKENAFRQFRMNQRVSQVTRFIPMDLWDARAGEVAPEPGWLTGRLEGRRCWAGLDLSSKIDLTAWCLLFEDGWALWRLWCPEAVEPRLTEATGGKFGEWCRAGWVTLTDGDTIDYDAIYDAVVEDHGRFAIASVTYDKWSGEPVRQEVEKRTGLALFESSTTYEHMTKPLDELERALRAGDLSHGANPVLRWMADALRVKSPADDPDRKRPVKPDRKKEGVRIDGLAALLFAIEGRSVVAEEAHEPFVLFGRRS